jgi:hypothetical protein
MVKIELSETLKFNSVLEARKYFVGAVAAAAAAAAAAAKKDAANTHLELPDASYLPLENEEFFDATLVKYYPGYALLASRCVRRRLCVHRVSGNLSVYVERECIDVRNGMRYHTVACHMLSLDVQRLLFIKKNPHDADVDRALRALVVDQFREFGRACSAPQSSMRVAYRAGITFESLRDAWFVARGNISAEFLRVQCIQNVIWELADAEISEDWADFHRIYAEYEWAPSEPPRKSASSKQKTTAPHATSAKRQKLDK